MERGAGRWRTAVSRAQPGRSLANGASLARVRSAPQPAESRAVRLQSPDQREPVHASERKWSGAAGHRGPGQSGQLSGDRLQRRRPGLSADARIYGQRYARRHVLGVRRNARRNAWAPRLEDWLRYAPQLRERSQYRWAGQFHLLFRADRTAGLQPDRVPLRQHVAGSGGQRHRPGGRAHGIALPLRSAFRPGRFQSQRPRHPKFGPAMGLRTRADGGARPAEQLLHHLHRSLHRSARRDSVRRNGHRPHRRLGL